MKDEKKTKEQLIEELADLRRQCREVRGECDSLRASFDDASVIVISLDASQRVTFINRTGCDAVKAGKDEVLGKNWFDHFIPVRDRKAIRKVFRKLMSGEVELARHFDNVILTTDGEEKVIAWHNTLLKDAEGKITGTFSIGEDITDRRRVDEEKENLIRTLREEITTMKSLRTRIPVCALNSKNVAEGIREHYDRVSKEGTCSECFKALK